MSIVKQLQIVRLTRNVFEKSKCITDNMISRMAMMLSERTDSKADRPAVGEATLIAGVAGFKNNGSFFSAREATVIINKAVFYLCVFHMYVHTPTHVKV